MDTSKEYILMCEKAKELQVSIYKHDDNSWFYCLTHKQLSYRNSELESVTCFYNGWDGFHTMIERETQEEIEFIWIPRQDQLQNLWNDDGACCLMALLNWLASDNNELTYVLPKVSNSLEQLWLAFIMDSKFHKRWNGTDWIVMEN
jgi:hypothetical protein